jgi:hypothetical protein
VSTIASRIAARRSSCAANNTGQAASRLAIRPRQACNTVKSLSTIRRLRTPSPATIASVRDSLPHPSSIASPRPTPHRLPAALLIRVNRSEPSISSCVTEPQRSLASGSCLSTKSMIPSAKANVRAQSEQRISCAKIAERRPRHSGQCRRSDGFMVVGRPLPIVQGTLPYAFPDRQSYSPPAPNGSYVLNKMPLGTAANNDNSSSPQTP